jgi:hypothetical protein
VPGQITLKEPSAKDCQEMNMDKKFRVPRVWSNRELEKFAAKFRGKVVNVSGWKDIDKEGRKYRDYFSNSQEYWITNYKKGARGFQGDQENELFLDLSVPLSQDFPRFDVVFNHTVLEHIFELETAFSNLVDLANEFVVIVVPFLQEQHAGYGDFWRFTPQAIDRLFKSQGVTPLYISWNDHYDASIYVFAIGSKTKLDQLGIGSVEGNMLDRIYDEKYYLGRKIIGGSWLKRLMKQLLQR